MRVWRARRAVLATIGGTLTPGAPLILTVTCNPAVDVTYDLRPGDRLVPDRVHRVARVARRPGGKGVNVARVLHALGESVHAVGLADARFAGTLAALGVPADFLAVMAEVRRTLVVRDAGTTSLWEPGPEVPASAADDLTRLVERLLPQTSALVVSGSLPPGVPVELPARLAARARRYGVPAVLDLDGDALAAAVDGSGAVVTPNEDELAGLVGPVDDLDAAARALAARTGASAVLTRGAAGMLVATGGSGLDEVHRAAAPERVEGNPTGAGDAATAGVALGLAHGWPWPTTLAHAVALGAAAVRCDVAGEVDLATYDRLVPTLEPR